jgi:hypothetical protein
MLSHCKNVAILVVFLTRLSSPLLGQGIGLRGRVTDPQGNGLPNASVQLIRHDSGAKGEALGQTTSEPDGQFEIKAASAGEFDIRVDAEGFRQVIVSRNIRSNGNPEITIQMGQISRRVETVTVTADVNGTAPRYRFPDIPSKPPPAGSKRHSTLRRALQEITANPLHSTSP